MGLSVLWVIIQINYTSSCMVTHLLQRPQRILIDRINLLLRSQILTHSLRVLLMCLIPVGQS